MSLEICTALAKSNKANENLVGLRIINGTVYASDFVNRIKRENVAALNEIDCYVNAEQFATAWKAIAARGVVTQNENNNELILCTTGSKAPFRAELGLLPVSSFKINLAEPTGEEVEPKNFLFAITNILPFTKTDNAATYIIDNYLYVTNGTWVIRTPLECEFPEALNTRDNPLTFSKQFMEMCSKWIGKLTKLLVTNTTITAVFENGWIESARYEIDAPQDYALAFESIKDLKVEPFDEDILPSLKAMCDEAGDKDMISFGPKGISLKQDSRIAWHIDCKMPPLSLRATDLNTIITHGTMFNFESPRRTIFRGKFLDGIWPNKPIKQEKPEKEKELVTTGKGRGKKK